jgi:uncharacterized protein (TIGR02466 family)
MQVLDIFPIPIIYKNIADLIDHDLLNKLINMDETDPLTLNKGHNYFTTNRELLTTVYKDSRITQEIEKTLDDFIKNIYNEPTSKIRITQSWINFNPTGTSHLPHNHANSILSGVLYLSVNDKTGDFKFYRPSSQQRMICGQAESLNPYNSEFCRLKPKFGDLYLFPSTMVHGVERNESNITRVSLAFNSFYTGELLNTPLSELILV